ncbi:MAG: serine/threonine protein kinase [Deltaproteobacteria bacterium]|nr:serine/threonine protein kinase [Deltaproteobacteria bacterium]
MDATLQNPRVPGFVLDRLIGEGGFGQVWRAQRADTCELVAIKILHLELVRSTDAMRRFQRELEAIGRLEHPNVVRAIDHGTLEDGRPYLILEHVEGPSLREAIHERGALPPTEMLQILGPLCDALVVAHAAGLVHRDVKASNVILARRNGALRPVLLDFGLVKLIDEVGPGLTSSRSMLGTPAAMAPEQIRGQNVDARTDVYALGLLTYHMLTGQPAYGGAPGVVQSYLQVHGPRPRPSSKADIDPMIDEPVARALAPDPAERYQSPSDLFLALKTVIERRASAPVFEIDVVVLYVEGSHDDVAQVSDIATRVGMTIALAAPDSVVAVMRRDTSNVSELRTALAGFGEGTRIALGVSRATINAHVVDGPALDVEGWAPYPLPPGLWVADGL